MFAHLITSSADSPCGWLPASPCDRFTPDSGGRLLGALIVSLVSVVLTALFGEEKQRPERS